MLKGDLYRDISEARDASGRTWASIGAAVGMQPNNAQAAIKALQDYSIKNSVVAIAEELGYDIIIRLERKE